MLYLSSLTRDETCALLHWKGRVLTTAARRKSWRHGFELSCEFSSAQFSHSIMFDCLQPYELQHTKTNSQSPPQPMSIESVMPSGHLILCHPLLLLPSWLCKAVARKSVFSYPLTTMVRRSMTSHTLLTWNCLGPTWGGSLRQEVYLLTKVVVGASSCSRFLVWEVPNNSGSLIFPGEVVKVQLQFISVKFGS